MKRRRPIYRIVDWLGYEPAGADSLKPLPDIVVPSARFWPHRQKVKSAATLGVFCELLRIGGRIFPRGVFINERGVGIHPDVLARGMGFRTAVVENALKQLAKAELIEEITPAE